MSPGAITLCILAQLFLVGGQLYFKRAMDAKSPHPRPRKLGFLAVGIVLQSVWFFLWLGLLQHEELSRVFPFEGLDPLLLAGLACFVLRERLTPAGWVGIGLITAGLVLVAV